MRNMDEDEEEEKEGGLEGLGSRDQIPLKSFLY